MNSLPPLPQACMLKTYLVSYVICIVKRRKISIINLEDEIIEKSLIKKFNYGNRSVYI